MAGQSNDGEAPTDLLHIAQFYKDYDMFDELVRLSGERLAPPASKAALESLKDDVITVQGKQCAICVKDYKQGEKVKKMPCTHQFHTDCLLPWLAKTNACPLCRYELKAPKITKPVLGVSRDTHYAMYS